MNNAKSRKQLVDESTVNKEMRATIFDQLDHIPALRPDVLHARIQLHTYQTEIPLLHIYEYRGILVLRRTLAFIC